MTYVNQDIYSGNWANGKKDGQGTYIFQRTGEKFVGTFKNGQITKGKWIYPNGSFFEGNFGFNQPKGVGTWNFANGNKVQGSYGQSKRADVDGDEIKLSWKTLSDISKWVSYWRCKKHLAICMDEKGDAVLPVGWLIEMGQIYSCALSDLIRPTGF